MFPSYQTALQLSHLALSELPKGARVVDATLGNGYDTRFLAEKVGPEGRVWAFDTQREAINRCLPRMTMWGISRQVQLIHDGHQNMIRYVSVPLDAVLFNLGWLPGDKKPREQRVTTHCETTIAALEAALPLLAAHGLLLVCIYPGHAEGFWEKQGLAQWCKQLPQIYSACWTEFPNHNDAPALMMIQRCREKKHQN